tara:strand:+ start:110 stop:379 length:270 start_codon:yes stop_codon:yes gene_type:complete
MFKTIQYYYWNLGYILSDVVYEIKRNVFYNNSSYYAYSWRDDTLLNEIYKLEERIAELEDSKDEKTDLVVILNNRKDKRLNKLKRNNSF